MTLKQQIGKKLIPALPVNRRTFDILRFEANALKSHLSNKLSPSYRKELDRIKALPEINLNVGSGGQGVAGWVNTDVLRHNDASFVCDIRRGLPFKPNTVARIFAEHVIEHIDFRNDVPFVFSEFYRVLKPGGRVRIIVPDMYRYIEAYFTGEPAKWAALGFAELPDDMPTRMALVNHAFHQGGEHLFGYDFDTLKGALAVSGFSIIERSRFGVSDDAKICLDRNEHASYSLYVEAVK